MADRTQINFRLDNSLLAAIKEVCDREDITQTDFITHAIKKALGIPTSNYSPVSALPKIEPDDRIAELIDSKLAGKLDEHIASLLDSKLSKQLDDRLSGLESAIAGKLDTQIDSRIEDAIARQMTESLGELAA